MGTARQPEYPRIHIRRTWADLTLLNIRNSNCHNCGFLCTRINSQIQFSTVQLEYPLQLYFNLSRPSDKQSCRTIDCMARQAFTNYLMRSERVQRQQQQSLRDLGTFRFGAMRVTKEKRLPHQNPGGRFIETISCYFPFRAIPRDSFMKLHFVEHRL